MKNFEKEKEYNENINSHPEIVQKLILKDNYVLVRLFKYEKESITEGGIIVKDITESITDSGKKKGELNKNPYQLRGIVVKISPVLSGFSNQLNEGNIVHICPGNYFPFNIDKTNEVAQDYGYFMLHVGAIECIEML